MNEGEGLIFIISRPRSGTSLLQHILGSHSQVGTCPEAWFMLHLCYGLKNRGIACDYNASFAQVNLQRFLQSLPDGETVYWRSVRAAATTLYDAARASCPGRTYFLDKSNRYYFILPELKQVFPNAHYIFLLRNPLAVWCSFLEVNLKGDFTRLAEAGWRHDVVTAPRLIAAGIREFGDRATVVHYEELVSNPGPTIETMCGQIGIPFEPAMLHYKGKVNLGWGVDPKNIYRHEAPVTDYRDAWRTHMNTRLQRRLARGYLETLGEQLVGSMGYDFDELMAATGVSTGHPFGDGRINWPLFQKAPCDWSRTQRLTFGLAKRLRNAVARMPVQLRKDGSHNMQKRGDD